MKGLQDQKVSSTGSCVWLKQSIFFLLTVKMFYSSFSKFFKVVQKQATCEKMRRDLFEPHPEEIMAGTWKTGWKTFLNQSDIGQIICVLKIKYLRHQLKEIFIMKPG